MPSRDRTIPTHEELVWDLRQVGAWLGISTRSIVRRVTAGEWPCHKLGNRYRFTAEDRAQILASMNAAAYSRPEPPTARIRRLRQERAS